MPSRPSTTLLLITPQRLVRADFGRSAARGPVEMRGQARPAVQDLVGLVETAARLGGRKLGKRVFVLTSDVFMQAVELPEGTTAGIEPDELRRALAFEAEALSDINALDASVGYVPLGSAEHRHQFLVTAIDRRELSSIDEVIRRGGAKLGGVGAPAALAKPISAELGSAGTWTRTELWPETIVCVGQRGGGAVEVAAINGDPRVSGWEGDVASWRESLDAGASREMLLPIDVDLPVGASEQHIVRLGDEDALATWLGLWADRLNAGSLPTGMVPPPARAMRRESRVAVSAALAVLAAAGCVLHYTLVTRGAEADEQMLKELRAPAERLAELEEQRDAVRRDFAALQNEQAEVEERLQTALVGLRVHKDRLPVLLGSLAESRPPNLLVRSIEGDAMGAVIRGVALRAEDPNELARDLAGPLRPLWWRVEPPEKKALNRLRGGGPWAFEIRLTLEENGLLLPEGEALEGLMGPTFGGVARGEGGSR